MRYRIIKNTVWDHDDRTTMVYYTIEQGITTKIKRWFKKNEIVTKWQIVSRGERYYDSFIRIPIKFMTLQDAENYISANEQEDIIVKELEV